MKLVSLFAGIGGFDLGFERAGFETVAHVEKEKTCRELLSRRFPSAKCLDDVCTAGAHNLPKCDVLAAGFPCQDLSIAGQRSGLSGARSGLFFQFTRMAYELRPAYLVWENVPGLLSSDEGRDMCRVLMEFQRIGYVGGWRTFDAQYLGVAQHRRRIFGVFARRDIGAASCAEILSLAEGVRWHPAPRRQKGKEAARTLGGGSGERGWCSDTARATFVAGTLCGNGKAAGSAMQQDSESKMLIISHALRSEGADASEDGTGRGTPLIVDCLRTKRPGEGGIHGDDTHLVVSPSLNCQSGQHHAPDTKAYIVDTLTSNSDAHSGHRDEKGLVACVRTAQTSSNGNGIKETGTSYTLDGASGQAVKSSQGVRRLTPLECERLMGFPDGWTEGFSDSRRYKMLGNAVVVSVSEWIAVRMAKQIARFDAWLPEMESTH